MGCSIPAGPARRRCDNCWSNSQSRTSANRAGSLSGGERRRLEIARCLVTEPEIILLDEPFTGIDPVTIESIQKIIRDLKARGISILITDHQVRETLQITDRSYVVVKGQVLVHGPPDEVLRHPQARELYFGSGLEAGLSAVPPPHLPIGPPTPPPVAVAPAALCAVPSMTKILSRWMSDAQFACRVPVWFSLLSNPKTSTCAGSGVSLRANKFHHVVLRDFDALPCPT
jgi:ABC-type antimicrobial peptide transport system ATPase subunit